jgi:hypothetical protein
VANPYTSSPPKFTDDHLSAAYDHYQCVTKYIWDSGIVQIPAAQAPAGGLGGAGGPNAARPGCQVVQLSAPCGKKVVSWVVKRSNAPPVCPSPDPGTPNEVLAHGEVTVMAPVLHEDGETESFAVAGVFTYLMAVPVWLLDGLPMGTTPFDTTPAANNVFPGQLFVTALQGSGVTPQNSNGQVLSKIGP